ncbi:hypothetical protein C7M84_020231 [Penaeus vannamei]|uniref:Uncharacterized protein n=1 Tax=Penaeus vannamei TaxID=6689 RepID=A0A423SCK2_PENVA|nr:hypothetical protein C7M84_020231 [Penaeus vannamei]
MTSLGIASDVFGILTLRLSAWLSLCLCLALCASGASRAAWLPCVPHASYKESEELHTALPTTLAVRPEGVGWSAGFRLTSPAREWTLGLASDDGSDPLVKLESADGTWPRRSRPPGLFERGNWTEMKVEVTADGDLLIELTRESKVHQIIDANGSACGNVSLHVEQLLHVVMSRDCPLRCVAEQARLKFLEGERNTLHVLHRGDYSLSIALVYTDCIKKEKRTGLMNLGKDDIFLKPREWNKMALEYIHSKYHGISITINDNQTHEAHWNTDFYMCHQFVKLEIRMSTSTLWSLGCRDSVYQKKSTELPRWPLTCSAETTRPPENQTTDAPTSPPQTSSTDETSNSTPTSRATDSGDGEALASLSLILAMVLAEVMLAVCSVGLTLANRALGGGGLEALETYHVY